MLFNSIDFLLFFPIVVLIYYLIPQKIRYIRLLIASYFFYMCWNAKYSLILFVSTLITYMSGRLIANTNKRELDPQKCKKIKIVYVVLSFTINLLILAIFKYFNFGVDSINSILEALHISVIQTKISLLLPVGISFYIFQALSYTMDVYREEIPAEKNFLKYAVFVSFFPQLVAGPIERSKNLLQQFDEVHKFNYENVKRGLQLMLWGYFMKMVIADRAAIMVDKIYSDYTTYSGAYLIVGTLLFAIQIYCDFAGYSTIAIGAAQVMGFSLMENFNAPYLAQTVGEFWRRWHISLTSWFRDYLYIPLGGNRKGTIRKYINMGVVFLVSGLWHGAMWTYVIWGGLNGIYVIIGDIWKTILKKCKISWEHKLSAIFVKGLKIVVTFSLINISWIFFRAGGTKEAFEICKSIFHTNNFSAIFTNSILQFGLDKGNLLCLLGSILMLTFVDIFHNRGFHFREWIGKQKTGIRWAIYLIAIEMIFVCGIWGALYDKANFIYFQF